MKYNGEREWREQPRRFQQRRTETNQQNENALHVNHLHQSASAKHGTRPASWAAAIVTTPELSTPESAGLLLRASFLLRGDEKDRLTYSSISESAASFPSPGFILPKVRAP